MDQVCMSSCDDTGSGDPALTWQDHSHQPVPLQSVSVTTDLHVLLAWQQTEMDCLRQHVRDLQTLLERRSVESSQLIAALRLESQQLQSQVIEQQARLQEYETKVSFAVDLARENHLQLQADRQTLLEARTRFDVLKQEHEQQLLEHLRQHQAFVSTVEGWADSVLHGDDESGTNYLSTTRRASSKRKANSTSALATGTAIKRSKASKASKALKTSKDPKHSRTLRLHPSLSVNWESQDHYRMALIVLGGRSRSSGGEAMVAAAIMQTMSVRCSIAGMPSVKAVPRFLSVRARDGSVLEHSIRATTTRAERAQLSLVFVLGPSGAPAADTLHLDESLCEVIKRQFPRVQWMHWSCTATVEQQAELHLWTDKHSDVTVSHWQPTDAAATAATSATTSTMAASTWTRVLDQCLLECYLACTDGTPSPIDVAREVHDLSLGAMQLALTCSSTSSL